MPKKRWPQEGETWRSRDPRDGGLLVTILQIRAGRVQIKRYKRTWVSLSRFHRDYELVSDA